MFFQSLKLFQIRNLHDQTFSFSPGVNLVSGRNGQGKTNLIEAIYLLCVGKSFRTNEIHDLVRWGEKEASVFGTVCAKLRDLEIGMSIEQKRKHGYLYGNPVSSLAEIIGKVPCVSFTPNDIALIKGAPSARRSFLDKHLVDLDPSYLRSLVNYQRALRSKNALLKNGRETTPEMLDPWNQILAESGVQIVKARQRLVSALLAPAARVLKSLSLDEGELTLHLESDSYQAVAGDLTSTTFYEALSKVRRRELDRRRTELGPHRDDLAIGLAGQDSRAFASQGQSRSLVLALLVGVLELLESRHSDSPIVILDDVESELDSYRCTALFEMVFNQNRQIFLTGTDFDRHSALFSSDFSHIRIDGGNIAVTV